MSMQTHTELSKRPTPETTQVGLTVRVNNRTTELNSDAQIKTVVANETNIKVVPSQSFDFVGIAG